MPVGLLVSVRSATEALAALAGGASVIDVKEPARGPLGRADEAVWRSVRAVVPETIPLSVALGELSDWQGDLANSRPDFSGIDYRKLGLAAAGWRWADDWRELREAWWPGPQWVAVVYADWQRARAPHPEEVGALAREFPDCAGVLIDTWDKSQPSPLDRSWASWIADLQAGGRFVTLAGGLDDREIQNLLPLRPNLFGVRGSACVQGNRLGEIDPERVAMLVRLLQQLDRSAGESEAPGKICGVSSESLRFK